MKLKIYRVPASHPCQAVIRAAELKGVDHKVVDLMPLTQPLVATLAFGSRTVPAMKIYGGPSGTEKVQTTTKCLRAIESLVPDPPLYPAAADELERVLAAETFGVGEFQDVTRRIVWVALRNSPAALFSFDTAIPIPDALLKPFARPTIWGERLLNSASLKNVRKDVEGLPEWIDQIDRFIADGAIGGAQANAGDLTIFSSIWLLRSLADLRPMLDARPTGRKAKELFGEAPGEVPEGSFDAAWLTNVNAARGAAAPA